MPTFFGGGPIGRTVGCDDTHAEGTTVFVKTSPNITWNAQRSIITRVTVAYQGNFQFLHTIGNDVYVYVFGDRIGQITISGLSLTSCDGGQHGFEKMLQWYGENRLAVRKQPIEVWVGNTPIKGFVAGITGDVIDPSTRIVQYGLQLAVLPGKK